LGSLENFVSFRHSQGSWSGVLIQDQTLLTQGDWELLYQLIATRDRLEEVSTHQQREKLAYHLSYAVLEFHRHCQLFNQQQSDFRQVAIIRFSAIAIAAQLLSNCGY
jgi:hypothetical protein